MSVITVDETVADEIVVTWEGDGPAPCAQELLPDIAQLIALGKISVARIEYDPTPSDPKRWLVYPLEVLG